MSISCTCWNFVSVLCYGSCVCKWEKKAYLIEGVVVRRVDDALDLAHVVGTLKASVDEDSLAGVVAGHDHCLCGGNWGFQLCDVWNVGVCGGRGGERCCCYWSEALWCCW